MSILTLRPKESNLGDTLLEGKGWRPCQHSPLGQRTATLSTLYVRSMQRPRPCSPCDQRRRPCQRHSLRVKWSDLANTLIWVKGQQPCQRHPCDQRMSDLTNALLEGKGQRPYHRSPCCQRKAGSMILSLTAKESMPTLSLRSQDAEHINAFLENKGWWPYQRSPWGQRMVAISSMSLRPKGGDDIITLLGEKGW